MYSKFNDSIYEKSQPTRNYRGHKECNKLERAYPQNYEERQSLWVIFCQRCVIEAWNADAALHNNAILWNVW